MSRENLVYLSLLASFICYITFYIANIHLIQSLSDAAYGDIYSAIKVLIIISSLSIAAKQAMITRYKPQFERTHRRLHKIGLIPWLRTNMMISALILAIGAVLSYALHIVALSPIFQAAFTEHPIHFLIFFMPILLFCIILISLALSQPKLSPQVISILTITPSIILSSILVLSIQTLRPTPLSMLFIYMICQISIFAIYTFITYKFNHTRFLSTYEPREHTHYYAQGDHFWISTFSYQLSIGLSLLALEAFSSEQVVGQYAMILLFAVAYYSLLSPLYTYLSSQLDLHLETGPHMLQPLLKRITHIQIIAVILLSFLAWLISPYTQNYIQLGQDNFQILVLIACTLFSLCMITAPALRVLLHSRYASLGQRLQIIQLVMTIFILIIAIPQYGIVGALIADTIPLLFIHLISYYVCRHHLNIHPFPTK